MPICFPFVLALGSAHSSGFVGFVFVVNFVIVLTALVRVDNGGLGDLIVVSDAIIIIITAVIVIVALVGVVVGVVNFENQLK